MKTMTTDESTKLQNLTLADVLKAYSGKPGCLCGCNGRYYVTAASRAIASANRGYAYNDKDVSEAQVLRILRLVQAQAATKPESVEDFGSGVEARVGGRAYVLYFMPAPMSDVSEPMDEKVQHTTPRPQVI
jgi:hypothetical protein